jgi:hypothetical protein
MEGRDGRRKEGRGGKRGIGGGGVGGEGKGGEEKMENGKEVGPPTFESKVTPVKHKEHPKTKYRQHLTKMSSVYR